MRRSNRTPRMQGGGVWKLIRGRREPAKENDAWGQKRRLLGRRGISGDGLGAGAWVAHAKEG
jgi:hypothetical protein